ncbi:MAG: metallophosphoesterase [Flavobacteriaceae bacterium]|nr:metallophosphoesterase [Flavobacteriaceae bacterium]
MKTILVTVLVLLLSCKKERSNSFEIGIISDCQYCDCEIKWDRYFKKSPARLKQAVEILNKEDLEYTIHLGDFIDRDFKSFDSILPIWNKLKSEKRHVLGNHDFEVKDSLKPKVISKLGLKNRYYSFVKNNWKFIVMDGNDLSFYGATDPIKKTQTDSIYNLMKYKNLPYVEKWNGALSNIQLKWIKDELESAKEANQLVGFYCHFPIYPIDIHNIWNREQFVELISDYDNVKIFFNGHNHAGAYQHIKGVHYLTFKGMVDTKESSSFAKALFTKDSIIIKGYGREVSRRLSIL